MHCVTLFIICVTGCHTRDTIILFCINVCYSCFVRFVTQLLMDLVYFVTEHDSSGEDILNIQVQSPNRDRQKLMREQNILKEVNNTLQMDVVVSPWALASYGDAKFPSGKPLQK